MDVFDWAIIIIVPSGMIKIFSYCTLSTFLLEWAERGNNQNLYVGGDECW
jgi:hypothetical protein